MGPGIEVAYTELLLLEWSMVISRMDWSRLGLMNDVGMEEIEEDSAQSA